MAKCLGENKKSIASCTGAGIVILPSSNQPETAVYNERYTLIRGCSKPGQATALKKRLPPHRRVVYCSPGLLIYIVLGQEDSKRSSGRGLHYMQAENYN